jgi:peptidylprolyl isomerase/FKBP-type peptidyl-prolyl cis-trans isomerase FkpA
MKNKKLLIVGGIVCAWALLVAFMVMSNRSSQPSSTNTNTSMDTSKLIIEDEVIGKGEEAKAGMKVTVHYVGILTDGTMFDASRKHGNQGFTFALGAGQVIKGWDVGVAGMKVGGKRKLTIPSDMAYGNQAVGSIIPANATLVFEVELLKVTK